MINILIVQIFIVDFFKIFFLGKFKVKESSDN